jgi:exosortase/archaeosortase
VVADEQAGGAEQDPSSGQLPPAARLQILTTEHWSLLSTRALSWNEAFSRASMFLSALSGGVIALALAAQATSFDARLTAFALLLLTPILFLGIATFVRLVEINREEVRWVIGMNLLRHAYLEAAPELRPYFVTGWHDDEAGIMTTFGATAGPGGFRHEFVTTPGVLAVVDGTLAGALAAMLGGRADVGAPIALGSGVAVFAITIALLSVFQYRRVVRPRGLDHVRFPGAPAGVDLLQGPWSGRLR